MTKKKIKTQFAIIGSGAGGATLAYELAKRGKKVILLERGPLAEKIGTEARTVKFYDKYGRLKTKEGITIYRTIMAGGTTIVSCGNGVRSLEKELLKLSIDIKKELDETEKELGVAPIELKFIGEGTKKIWESAQQLGHKFVPMPKFIDFEKCASCGKCILGCAPRAKWTALDYFKKAQALGALCLTEFKLNKIIISNNTAIGIDGEEAKIPIEIEAEKIILAAGAIESPRILQKLGIEAGNNFFCDLFTVVYGITKNSGLSREPTMSIVNHEHLNEGFILSPFLDTPLSMTLSHPSNIMMSIKHDKVLGIMVKIKDDSAGKINPKTINKKITTDDRSKINHGNEIAREILIKAGVNLNSLTIVSPRGAHPGGTAAIGEITDINQETKIKNLFVNDASVLPEAPGLPPILTIIALSKRLAKLLC